MEDMNRRASMDTASAWHETEPFMLLSEESIT